MDPEGTQELLSFLREKVRTQGMTLFISSHLMSEIEEFCDTVFVVNHGHLVASGAVRELLQPHRRVVRVTFQGRVPEAGWIKSFDQIQRVESLAADTLEFTLARDDSAWLNECLLQQGYRVSAVTPKQRTLKEFFLAITGEEHNHPTAERA
jgi:ABC-2 type transport system ATP-binding protein